VTRHFLSAKFARPAGAEPVLLAANSAIPAACHDYTPLRRRLGAYRQKEKRPDTTPASLTTILLNFWIAPPFGARNGD